MRNRAIALARPLLILRGMGAHRYKQWWGVDGDSASASDTSIEPCVEIVLGERDIACAEPAQGSRATVTVRYAGVNAFVSAYLRARRGEPLAVAIPAHVTEGDVIDVDIRVAGEETIALHGLVRARALPLAEVQLVAGPLTDRVVAPLVERALGTRLARHLLPAAFARAPR
jgi:hypothetical protein